MSFLDIDERLIELADKIDIVYSPLVDTKEFPPEVDVTLVEGAVSSDEDLEKIKHIRAKTKLLISLGDCAITANVPSMRNPYPVEAIMNRAYQENVTLQPQWPDKGVPKLLKTARPLHEFVKVDLYVPGCPPSADVIHFAIGELLAGRVPDLSSRTHFGA
jgi:NAD-reducing hydrogenase small subunit